MKLFNKKWEIIWSKQTKIKITRINLLGIYNYSEYGVAILKKHKTKNKYNTFLKCPSGTKKICVELFKLYWPETVHFIKK